MGIEKLRKNREKRWDKLLNYAYSECDRKYSTCKTSESEDRYLISELSEIRFANDSYLENYLLSSVAPTLTFTDLYKSIRDSIPVQWFQNSSPEILEQNFQLYNNLSVLAGLSDSTRQMIWIDIPRTFNIFNKRSPHCQNVLLQSKRKEYYLTILCRVLSMTSCLLGGWYCQGMSFVAASYIFYYDDISESFWSSQDNNSDNNNNNNNNNNNKLEEKNEIKINSLLTTSPTTTTTIDKIDIDIETQFHNNNEKLHEISIENKVNLNNSIENEVIHVNNSNNNNNNNTNDINIPVVLEEKEEKKIESNQDSNINDKNNDCFNDNDERLLTHELYTCCTYYSMILQSNNLSALYEWSVFLAMYLEEFEYQLSHTPETHDIYVHLQDLKYPIEFFSMEWFTTCYVLSTSYEVTVYIQDIMIYGNQNGSRVDILIRIGMAIILNLREEILSFEDLETMQLEFRNLVLKLTPEQIIPQAIRYHVKKRSGGGSGGSDTNELSDSSTISNNILSRMLATPERSSLNYNDQELKTSSELLEWHNHRLVTTIDKKGYEGMYSTTNTSLYSIERSDGSVTQISNCAPQCLIS